MNKGKREISRMLATRAILKMLMRWPSSGHKNNGPHRMILMKCDLLKQNKSINYNI